MNSNAAEENKVECKPVIHKLFSLCKVISMKDSSSSQLSTKVSVTPKPMVIL